MSKTRKKKFDHLTAQASARRKAHFAQGGSLAQWRGRAAVFKDRRRRLEAKALKSDQS
jgi:hypothetical protein